jgi:hypothetical protein
VAVRRPDIHPLNLGEDASKVNFDDRAAGLRNFRFSRSLSGFGATGVVLDGRGKTALKFIAKISDIRRNLSKLSIAVFGSIIYPEGDP